MVLQHLHNQASEDCSCYGRGAAVGRVLGVGITLGVPLGVDVAVAVAVPVGVGVGLGAPESAQYLPPVLKGDQPAQMIISLPVHTAV
jgi:hypothetical protein